MTCGGGGGQVLGSTWPRQPSRSSAAGGDGANERAVGREGRNSRAVPLPRAGQASGMPPVDSPGPAVACDLVTPRARV